MAGGQNRFQQVLVILDGDKITVADPDGEIGSCVVLPPAAASIALACASFDADSWFGPLLM